MSAQERTSLRPVFAENWERMIALGYSPVPLWPLNSVINGKIRDKSPCFKGWSPWLRSRLITKTEVFNLLRDIPKAEIGLVCGYKKLIAVDIDTLVKETQDAILSVLPPAPKRIGNPAKAGLFLYRWAGTGEAPNEDFEDVSGSMILELLGCGAQFVVPPSMHPTGSPYCMEGGHDIPPLELLPELTDDDVARVLEAIKPWRKLPREDAKPKGDAGDNSRLAPSLDMLRCVVEALPYESMAFRAWNRVGMAIFAAAGGDDAAFEWFDAWSSKAEGDEYSAEAVEAKWADYKKCPPDSLGFGTLLYMAGDSWRAKWTENDAARWFEDPDEFAAREREKAAETESIFPEEPKTKTGRFKLEPLADVVAAFDTSREEWLIKKIAPREGVGVLYGKSGAFKSFVALHIGLCVASGIAWAGRRVVAGPVVYVGAEASNGVRKRMSGYFRGCCIDGMRLDGPMHLVAAAPNLGVGIGDREELVNSVGAVGVRPVLIIVDTLAQTMGGADENGAGMAQYVVNATALSVKFKCLVVIVHHVGLSDDQRLRGHSSLKGAVDMQLLAERVETSMETILTLQKLKDDEDDISLRASLMRNVLKLDEDGDEVSTLIVRSIEQMGKSGEAVPDARVGVETDAQQATDERLLRAILANPCATMKDYAVAIGVSAGGLHRRFDRLAKEKLIVNVAGKWKASAKTEQFFRNTKPGEKDLFS